MTRSEPYPPSRVETVVEVLHGVEVADPYRWLEDASSPEVQAWVEAQNACTRRALAAVPGRSAIAARLAQLLEVGTLGVPAPVKGRYFYSRRDGSQNQPVLYVREGLHGEDRALIDPNTLAEDGTIALDWWYPSRDGKLLAYGLSSGGDEKSTLHVRDVATGVDLLDVIDRTRACAVAWLPDSSGFYYTRYPAPGTVPPGEEAYHRHVWFHRLGDDPASDVRVFGEGRPAEDWPEVRLSPDGRWLVITVARGWTSTAVYFRDRTDPASPWQPLVEGIDALFHVSVRNDRFYVHTNHQAPRYQLFEVDPLKPWREAWILRLPQGEDVLESAVNVGEVLIAERSRKACGSLTVHDRAGTLLHEVPLPTLGTIAGLGAEWDGQEFLFGFQSFIVPQTIYHVDLSKPLEPLKPALWGQVQVEADLSGYEVQQVTYASKDGTPVTMFLAGKKDLPRDGDRPTVLYGYGGFNISLTPSFSASRLLFFEAGGLLAVANLRGGGEYGEEWHRAGMLGHKQNVFDDYIAAAEWLLAQGYTRPARLAAMGGSNGGLLVGVALTQRPELFRAVVCQVPLLDMVRYAKFLIARLWVKEYGDPENPEHFRWLYAYSPYHRVREGVDYPAVLLVTAESDTRVDALHARKMAARLQAVARPDRPVLLRLETRAGHGAGKPLNKVKEELTDVWSFLFWQLGIEFAAQTPTR